MEYAEGFDPDGRLAARPLADRLTSYARVGDQGDDPNKYPRQVMKISANCHYCGRRTFTITLHAERAATIYGQPFSTPYSTVCAECEGRPA